MKPTNQERFEQVRAQFVEQFERFNLDPNTVSPAFPPVLLVDRLALTKLGWAATGIPADEAPSESADDQQVWATETDAEPVQYQENA